MLNFVLSAAGGVACPEAEALLCGAVARGQPCHAPGRWRMHCPNTPPTARERFASKRTPGRSPGARVVLGNGGKALAGVGLRGWASIEGERQLNLADGCAWARVFAGVEGTVAALFAEHVMEHMTPITVLHAAAAAFTVLRPGGRLRIAVPDGYHPRSDNRLGTNAISGSAPHRIMWTHETLSETLRRAGFEAVAQAYYSVNGSWHEHAWWERESEFGSVRRSSRHDKRFIVGGSLIVDGIKPAAC